MQIDSNNPVGSPVQGLESTAPAGAVKREKEQAAEQSAVPTEETPDYRLSLSEQSKRAVAELNGSSPATESPAATDMAESEAAQLATQVSAQLAQQTGATIANQAIQKAVDLFS